MTTFDISRIKHVGIDRPYTSINAAINAASSRDTILIDHGVYFENVLINKLVNLKGVSPYEDGVKIISNVDGPPIKINIPLGTTPDKLFIESIHTESNIGSWQRGIEIITNSNTESFKVYVNKCRIIATGRRFPIGITTNPVYHLGGLYITNCYLERGYAHTVYCDYIDDSSVISTECNNPFTSFGGDPLTIDTVYLPTSGYGPKYGTYLYKGYGDALYYFSGYTLEHGVPVSRLVRAETRTYSYNITTYSGGGVHHTASTISDPVSGEFVLVTRKNTPHNIICEDDSAGVVYRDLIASNIIPIKIT